MKQQHQLKKIAAVLLVAFSASAYASTPFVPFAPVPLHYTPKKSQQVPANVLVFMDNSYDGSRYAYDGKIPGLGNLGINLNQVNNKGQYTNKPHYKRIDVAKKVMFELVQEFPNYRWGISSYTPNDISMKHYATDAMCFEKSGAYNYATMGCTYATSFGDDIVAQLYQHEVGATLNAPIKTRTGRDIQELQEQIISIPVWGAANENASSAHESPLTSAYYEMTRYYRGLRTAYKKQNVPAAARTNGDENGEVDFGEGNQSAMRDGKGVQYVSPIQYRCQSNNIVIITSARDFRTAPDKGKHPFYEAYHTDPLFKHDNPEYLMDISGKQSQWNILAVSDLGSEAPAGTGIIASPQYETPYRQAYRSMRHYNDVYHPGSGKYAAVWLLPLGTKYVRSLDTVKYTHKPVLDGSNYPPRGSNEGDYIYTKINPYMDVIESISDKEAAVMGLKNFEGNKRNMGWDNVIRRNAYSEQQGLDAFAHLAHEGDIVARGSEYKYPLIINKGKALPPAAWMTEKQDSAMAAFGNKKALLYSTNNGFVRSDKDLEGKAWDGTDDKAVRNADGELVDYSRRWSKQHINTYTIGFGKQEEEKTIDDFPVYEVKIFGSTGQIYAPFPKTNDPAPGAYVYVENEDGKWVPLTATHDGGGAKEGEAIKVTAGALSGLIHGAYRGNLYITLNYNAKADEKSGNEPLLKVGSKFRVVDADTAKEWASPKVKGDTILKYAATKGGGLYFSINKADESALKEALKQVLAHIDAAMMTLDVGEGSAGIANKDDGKVTTAITTSLDSDRWFSQLRFYTKRKADRKDEFDTTEYTQPDYSNKTTIVSTPNGVRELTVSSDFNNETFNINPDMEAHNKGGLKVAVSKNENEWKNLVKWLTRRTDTDRDDTFKGKIHGVEQLIYRDRDPGSLEGHSIENARELGDVISSNIMLFGKQKTSSDADVKAPGDPNEYMAVGSNDGMVHIYRKRNTALNRWEQVMNYIPGTAKRQTEDDTILRNLVYTAEQNYGTSGNPHQYFVNGQLFYRRTDAGPSILSKEDNRGMLTLLGTLGQGGRAVYALNVGGYAYNGADKVGLDNGNTLSVPMWETSSQKLGYAYDGVDANMGYVFGRAQVGRVEPQGRYDGKVTDVRYAAIVPSGFNPIDEKQVPTLFILDHLGFNSMSPSAISDTSSHKPGKLIKAIKTTYSDSDTASDSFKSGLASPMGVDLDRNGITDVVYAGDQNGNMWRFDLRGNPSQWNAKMLFKGSPEKPITTAPTIYYKKDSGAVYVGFGTGSNLYSEDLNSTTVQTIYGVVDYVNADCTKNAAWCKTRTESDLVTQKIETQSTGTLKNDQGEEVETGYRLFSTEPQNGHSTYNPDATPYYGWKLDLVYGGNQQGERIVTDPLTVSAQNNNNASFIFTSTIYRDDTTDPKPSCNPDAINAEAWIMAIDAKTGGNPKSININGYKNLSGATIAGIHTDGYTVSNKVIDVNGPEINSNSALQDGNAAPIPPDGDLEIPPGTECKNGFQTVIATSGAPANKAQVILVPCKINQGFRRLSWREIRETI